jgi:RsiW-degrading membrane proteinase PrsW (M82 family)
MLTACADPPRINVLRPGSASPGPLAWQGSGVLRLRRLGTVPMLAVGLTEEAAKLIAPVAIVLYTRHRHLADGLLVGVASGAGFAASEIMGYAFGVAAAVPAPTAVVDEVLFLRGVLSPAADMAWTGSTRAVAGRSPAQEARRPGAPGWNLLAGGQPPGFIDW